jgi:cytochrome c biogenesis protein CcmG, thiol:disulfide interchange protein DsbE
VSGPQIKRRAWLTVVGMGVLLVLALVINRATARHASSSPLRASLIAQAKLPDCPTTTAAGKISNGLPSLTLPCLANGPQVELAKLRGPLVVNVWAGTYPPCRAEAPELRSFAAAARGRVAVLGVVDGQYEAETWNDALDASRGLALGYPSVWDAGGKFLQWTKAIGIPTSLFVRPDGTIAYRKVGPMNPGELIQLTQQYLGIAVAAAS